MRISRGTVIGLTTMAGIAFAASASAQDRYVDGPIGYGYRAAAPVVVAPPAPAPVVAEGRVIVAPLPPPPDTWRQRRQAYDAIFTKDKRVVYDSNLNAQLRDVEAYYNPPASAVYVRSSGPGVYYWSPPNRGYGPARSAAPPPSPPAVMYFSPPTPAGRCGPLRYWDGTRCTDARYYSPYQNPYKWRFRLN